MCDRVAIIARGEVVAAGTPAELSHAGGVEVDDRPRRARCSRRPRARTSRGSCASWSTAGEDVYEVRVLRSSLEDVYLEVVGGR